MTISRICIWRKFFSPVTDFLVETAANGREALDKARLNLPDLILSDILMPVMDGFSTVQGMEKRFSAQEHSFYFLYCNIH